MKGMPDVLWKSILWRHIWLGYMGFIDVLLTKIGFPKTVIAWIMVCITSYQFSMNINGEFVGYFQGWIGWDKEILSRLFRKMIDNQNFKFHRRCHKDIISHLFFANDLIFNKREVNSLCMVKNVLMEF